MARPTLKQIRDTLCAKTFTVRVRYLDTNISETIEYDIDTVKTDIENNTRYFLDTLQKLTKLDKQRVYSIHINSVTGRIELGIRAKSSNNI